MFSSNAVNIQRFVLFFQTFIISISCSIHTREVFCFPTGAADSKQVDQTPPFIIKEPGQSVDGEIICSHNIPNYEVILWYKQDQHKALKLLGYINLRYPSVEEDVKRKINFNGDGSKQSSLNISDLTLSDNAVYFCAESFTQTHQCDINIG
uniref:Ig-like domain-containing protein n=1 Tax=Cyprinodon variegatus TaxID=28743 RepID=A0A3Q2CG17_CYPVA